MPGLTISTIIDKKVKSRKLINDRLDYDMEYIQHIESYIYNYYSTNNYQRFFDKLFETER